MRATGLLACFIIFASVAQLRPGKEVTFTGALQSVTETAITIRLDDGRYVDARLPQTPDVAPELVAEALAAKYNVADQVEMFCKAFPATFDESVEVYRFLELHAIRRVRTPRATELANMLASHPWRGGNLLKVLEDQRPPVAPDADPVLARVRKASLEFTASLPNFVADETAKRYTAKETKKAPRWKFYDTIESEITLRGSRVSRDHIRKNGVAWRQPFQALPGFRWYGGFGAEVRPVFDPNCPTTIEADGREKQPGRILLAYRFRSAADGCFGAFMADYEHFSPARTGRVLVNESDSHVVSFAEKASGFPGEFAFAEREEHVVWDYVIISGESHMLPIAAEFVVRYHGGGLWRVVLEFKNHRHFEASSAVKYQ